MLGCRRGELVGVGIEQKELAAALWILPFSDVTIYLLGYKDKDEESEHRDLMD